MSPDIINQSSIKNYCEPTDWTVNELVAAISIDKQMKRSINIPRFQRGLVWDPKRQAALIESIKMGHPIGSLLLHEGSKITTDNNGKKIEVQTYALVDGLQRTNTLRSYISNPFQYFAINRIDDGIKEIVEDIFKITPLKFEQRDKFDKVLSDWISKIGGMDERKGFSGYKLAKKIRDEFAFEPLDEDEFESKCVEFLGMLKDELDISNYRVPIIIYKGPKNDLFKIFVKVNSGGKTLSKYQLCAAVWADQMYDVNIESLNVVTMIRNRYARLIKEKFIVADYDPNTLSDTFNIYEYVYGLGRVLEEKFPDLFRKSKDKNDFTSTISFKYIAISFLEKYDITKMETLPEKLGPLLKAAGQHKFEKAMENALQKLSEILRPYLSLNANQNGYASSFNSIYHNDYQLVSLAGKLLVTKFDENLNIRDNWDDNRSSNQLLRRIPQYYLYDILKGIWQGHGNFTAQNDMTIGSRYERDISLDDWEFILNSMYQDEMQKLSKYRAKVTPKKMLFLKYIYANTFTQVENQNNIYEVEHLVPVKRLKELIKTHELDGVQIDCTANLALIPKEINRDKKDLTVYQFYDEQVSRGNMSQSEADNRIKETERYTFTTREDLEFLMGPYSQDDYLNFLNKRFFNLKKQFYQKNQVPFNEKDVKRFVVKK